VREIRKRRKKAYICLSPSPPPSHPEKKNAIYTRSIESTKQKKKKRQEQTAREKEKKEMSIET